MQPLLDQRTWLKPTLDLSGEVRVALLQDRLDRVENVGEALQSIDALGEPLSQVAAIVVQ